MFCMGEALGSNPSRAKIKTTPKIPECDFVANAFKLDNYVTSHIFSPVECFSLHIQGEKKSYNKRNAFRKYIILGPERVQGIRHLQQTCSESRV